VQQLAGDFDEVEVLNPFKGVGYLPAQERRLREGFRVRAAATKLEEIVQAVRGVIEHER
jgi:hypothetical protein